MPVRTACGHEPAVHCGQQQHLQLPPVHGVLRPPVAPGDPIPLTALRDRALISLPQGTGIRSRLDDVCAAAGFTPRIAFEASNPMVLAQLAAQGLGVAIVPVSVAKSRDDLRPLTSIRPELRGRLAFAWRTKGPISPAARALVGGALRTLST